MCQTENLEIHVRYVAIPLKFNNVLSYNGSTSVFGADNVGSSPAGTTIFKISSLTHNPV